MPARHSLFSCSMDESLYDEFGNYIGPELNSSDEEVDEESEESEEENFNQQDLNEEVDREHDQGVNGSLVMHGTTTEPETSDSIVLHEDKTYYPEASEVYGDAEVLVMEEDAQPIETPIIEPVKMKKFSELEKEIPSTTVG